MSGLHFESHREVGKKLKCRKSKHKLAQFYFVLDSLGTRILYSVGRMNIKRATKYELYHSLAVCKIASVASTTVSYKAAGKRHYFATFI